MDSLSEYQKISLSGQWELCWQDTGTGNPVQVEKLLDTESIPCTVPGDVHVALTEAGIIQEPLENLNSKDCAWMEQKEFWYRKKFFVEDGFLQDGTELVLEGLDLTADIWLNGRYIGSHNNAFIEKVIDVSSVLHAGENVLVVRIDDGVHSVKDKPIDFMKYSWNGEQPYRAWMRKPQFVYGWDWTIWLPSCGIWKNVYLNSYSGGCLEDVHIQTRFDGEKITRAEKITLSVSMEAKLLKAGSYVLKCRVCGDDRYEAAEEVTTSVEITVTEPGTVSRNLELSIENPQLWWPNGAGKPYLYDVKVTVEDENGNVLHTVEKRHGLRTVRIHEEPLEDGNSGFTFVINDNKIFAKGANHVPADCFPGRITDGKNRALLTAAADAHMNMIRVWGGGVYESEGFMTACDELGIMVWHDFMFACAFYPDHVPEFYEQIRVEVTAAIKRLRAHASLVGWSGNNEIQEMYKSVKQWHPEQLWCGRRLYEELLPQMVSQLCPDRIYRESSPFGGDGPAGFDQGDQHIWHFTHRPDWEHYLDLWRFTDFDYKFLSEFGIIGAMNIESARKCIREDALNTQSPEWQHHTNSNSDYKLMEFFADKYFGTTDFGSLQSYILHSQVIQAEIMRHVYDELRCRKFRCSGVLLWTLSDSFGINNWSVIDYYLGKRPLYYYLKRSMAPVNVSFRGYEVQNFDGMAEYASHYKENPTPVELLVANDTLEDKPVTLEYRILTFDGAVLKQGTKSGTISANSVEKFLDVDISDIKDTFVPEKTILCAKVTDGNQILNENRYFFAPYKKLNLKPASVKWEVRALSGDKAELTLLSDTFVWMLHLADAEGVEFSDNDFDLLPGEKRTVILSGPGVSTFTPEYHSLNPEKAGKASID